MVRKPTSKAKTRADDTEDEAQTISLAKFLSQKAVYKQAAYWIIGNSPLLNRAINVTFPPGSSTASGPWGPTKCATSSTAWHSCWAPMRSRATDRAEREELL